MKTNFNRIIDFSFILLSIISLLLGFLVSDMNQTCPLFFIADVLLLISNIIYSLEKLNRKWIMLLFQVTTFTFLMGQSLFCYIENDFSRFELSHYELNLSNILIWISVFAMRLSYSFFASKNFQFSFGNKLNNINRNIFVETDEYYESNYIMRLRKASKVVFYISYIFLLIALFDKIQFVRNYSYVESYRSYTSSLSLWSNRISSISIPVLYIFLGTMPTKKQSRVPLILYSIYTVLTLGTQVRNKFVINAIMIIVYLLIRNHHERNDNWISKRTLKLGFIVVPAVLVFLSVMEYTRVGQNFEFSFFRLIREFFQNQGGSIRVIGFSERYKEKLLSIDHNYIFGSFIWIIKYNVISKFLFGISEPASGTALMASQSNQLSHALSYIYSPLAYANGYGIGSCYIAEAYVQFSFWGVGVLGALIGIISVFVDKYLYKKWTPLCFSFLLLFFSQIIYLPRSSFGSIISQVFTISNVLVFFLLFSYARGRKTNE